jgi:hypothetical protein
MRRTVYAAAHVAIDSLDGCRAGAFGCCALARRQVEPTIASYARKRSGFGRGRRFEVRAHGDEVGEHSLQSRRHQFGEAARVGLDDAGVHDEHDGADQRPAGAHCAQEQRGTGIAEIVGEERGRIGPRERIERFAHGIMLVRTHGAFAQPEHVAFLIVQGNGMRARRLDRRTHFLADGIEIDERTFRFAEGFALLHTSVTAEIGIHIYRTGAPLDVMVFAKTPDTRPRR